MLFKKVNITGKPLEHITPEMCIIAALVKRLGGEVIISNNEVQPFKFTGVTMYLSKNDSIVIKVS